MGARRCHPPPARASFRAPEAVLLRVFAAVLALCTSAACRGEVAADAGLPDAAADTGVTALPAVVLPAPGQEIPESGGLREVRVTVAGALESALREKLPDAVALPLTQVVARVLVWWLDLRRDLHKGDVLDVVFALPAGQEPAVQAFKWTSSQGQGERRVFRFQAPGAPFARLYGPDGEELEERLVAGPIDSYEQVTSLLRDGRRHHGVDFKAPVGTPVHLPFDGVLVRRNWSFRRNGNCLEFKDAATGRRAMFLHLSPIPKDVKVGRRFAKGEQVAQSGNTGRSTAPHLHYQLTSADGKVLDPFEVHARRRARVPDEGRPGFDAEVRRLSRYFAP